jgi:serine/tyrosine/threonine adenylyltransferase
MISQSRLGLRCGYAVGMQLGLEHSYAQLPARFFTEVQPAAPAAPRLLLWNAPLAAALGLDAAVTGPTAHELFSGRQLPDDARPIAMAYAGHQFGHFVPSLGDGRAILLGERRDPQGVLFDLQLKGAGRTPWCATGDGRAAVGPMLREFLISEAMHALGIPTTRSLAVVATGETVRREQLLPGAVLTRVAASHVRVGTFEYFAARGDTDAVETLLRFCIARHYPALADSTTPALDLLRAVAARQADLIAAWMSVGFIHGVMNTDNMTISGETIDYGPCAFMDQYDPHTVFSSIDQRGRYSYGNQPAIAQWNLARLAECLLPLMDADTARAVERATAIVTSFISLFETRLHERLRRKLALDDSQAGDSALIQDLLQLMHEAAADFTLTFRDLAQAIEPGDAGALPTLAVDRAAAESWLARWRARLATTSGSPAQQRTALLRANPACIPRNHRVEAALNAASESNDLQPLQTLLHLVQQPFDDRPGFEAFMQPAAAHERVLHTFCGT